MVVSRWNAALEGGVLGYWALSGLEPELNGSESSPALTGRGEVPALVCVYSDKVVVVVALAEVAEPSSVRLLPALLRYLTAV